MWNQLQEADTTEPMGVEESDRSKDSANSEPTTSAPHNHRQRRRLVIADSSESETEEPQDHPIAINEQDADDTSSNFLQGVTETNKGSDQSDVDEDHRSDNDTDDEVDENASDSEKRQDSSGKKVNIADFDDEEEFLLAGGEIEEAKKRKEW